jgi:hypothetical protein
MGLVTIIAGQVAYVDPEQDFADSGWQLQQSIAVHFPCNPGYLIYGESLLQLGMVAGEQYDVSYLISNYVSGQVYSILGSQNGISQTANGPVSQTFTWDGTDSFQFYSDGQLSISQVVIAEHLLNPDNGQTVVFNERFKQWSGNRSHEAEMYLRYSDKLFQFKNGSPWLADNSTLFNNFFGVQYPSVVTFYINLDPDMVKNFYSMRVQSNSVWGAVNQGDISVPPYDGKPNGQQSRLQPNNFRNLQGDWFADLLRDMTDPRFNDVVQALFSGAPLQGKLLEVTLTNNSISEIRLVSIDVSTMGQNFSYTANR